MTHKCVLLCCKHPNETYSCRSLPANRHEYPQTQLQGTWKPCNWVWCQWCHSPLEESLEGQNQHGQPIKESRHTVTYDIPIQHFYCMSIYLYSYLCVHPVQNSMYQYYIIYTVYIYTLYFYVYIYIYTLYLCIYIYCINIYSTYVTIHRPPTAARPRAGALHWRLHRSRRACGRGFHSHWACNRTRGALCPNSPPRTYQDMQK